MSAPIPRKHALLIGIDYYNDPNKATTTRRYDDSGDEMVHQDLKGCVNDILAIEKYLVDELEVEAPNITKLLAPLPGNPEHAGLLAHEPTQANIVQHLTKLCTPTVADPGDVVYIHYSGHGAVAKTVFPTLKQAKEKNGSIEDEVLVPVDVFRGGNYIRDLEFGLLLQKLVDYGLILTVVLDCCHSGGAVRGDQGLVRGTAKVYESDAKKDIPASISEITQRASVSRHWLEGLEGCVVVAACQDSELAHETTWKGKPSGALRAA
ncbi:hypothetical protein CkaCkLH20_09784 [Colletotrichum karsti]|uniref:Peptidase C14 caspase domain-containing protein n=1 Tax=Colletotrichum karsti TaxID=1095194 RepID=A0A9P6I5Y8_9PEZI|nr:uncharacterized protein CkaCkLH20_09784 [Colletotrichum karsti]KAF9872605.1 hypothetical protein CkaCkLH20_09784 [Colletotrichum karsti]